MKQNFRLFFILLVLFLSQHTLSGKKSDIYPEKRDFLSTHIHNLLFPRDTNPRPVFMLPTPESGSFFTIRASDFVGDPGAMLRDLLLKTPSVYMDGAAYYLQGEKMTEFLIDGNTFYNNNLLSVQTLPSDFVEKIEVFDDSSNPMGFNGVDDDESSKAINFITKKEYKNKSFFGRFYGGWGYKNYWNAGADFNYFEKNRIVNVIAQTNNVNQANYSPYDMLKIEGSSNITDFDQQFGGSVANSFLTTLGTINFSVIDHQQGINEDYSAGVSYFDRYNKIQYYVNYFFNATENTTKGALNRDYFSLVGSKLNYNEAVTAQSLNYNHRFKTRLYYYMNDLNLLRVNFSVNTQKTNGTNHVEANYMLDTLLLTNTLDTNHFDLNAFNFLTEINYWKKFKKERRTLMIDILPTVSTQENQTVFNTLLNNNTGRTGRELDFTFQYDAKSYGVSGDAIYTEPIAKRGTLMFTYKFGYTQTEVDKNSTLLPDIIMSTQFKDSMFNYLSVNDYFKNSLGMVYQFALERLRFNFGADAQYASLTTSVKEPSQKKYTTTQYTILPRASLYYNINENNILRMNYSSFTDAPSTMNLIETFSFSNPLNLTIGNSNLKQAWRNILNIRYYLLTPQRKDYFFAYFTVNYTRNYIGSVNNLNYKGIYDTTVVQNGVNITSFDNFNSYFHLYNYLNYSFYFQRIKSNLDIYTVAKYSQTPGRLNGEDGISKQTVAGIGLALKSGISEKIDFTISNFLYYNRGTSTWNKQNLSEYITNQAMFTICYSPWKGLLLQTDFTDNYTFSPGTNTNYILWNARVGYRFLQDKSLELNLSVHDILNQNQNIAYNITDSYSENTTTNNLQRYFMLSLVYYLNKVK